MKTKKILIISYHGGTGGVVVQIRNILESLRTQKNYSFEYCSIHKGGPVADEIKALGIPTHIIGMNGGLDLPGALRLYKFLRNGNYDLVAFHGLTPLVRLILLLARVKNVVISENGAIQGDKFRNREYLKYIHRFFNMFTSAYIVDCNRSVNDLVKEHHADPKRINVFFNGIDVGKFNGKYETNLKDDLNIPRDKYIIGTVRGLIPKMGLDHMIEVARITAKSRNDLHYVIVGDGPLRKQFEDKIKEYNLNNITLLGTRRDIPYILQSFDIFLLPSVWEGLPVCAVESIASGTPIIAYNVGGIKDIVITGYTGILIDERNYDLMAEKVLELIDNAPLREKMKANSIEFAKKEFDINLIAGKFLNLYETLIEKKC